MGHNRPGGTISIEVADGGLTVSNTSDEPALDERQIFNRFYRPRGGGGGDGLGLSIVRAIAEAHGGSVEAQEAPAGGALLVIRIPVQEDQWPAS